MSTFKEYLAESKKIYNFKIKIARDIDKFFVEQLKNALSKFDCTSVSKPKRTPISETPLDFPDVKFSHVNIFDVTCNYPSTSQEIAALVSEKTGVNPALIRVRNENEELERAFNLSGFQRIGTKSEPLLNKPYEDVDGQPLVGDKRVSSFLKDLSKSSHKGVQYTGVNDQLLAKSAPTGSANK